MRTRRTLPACLAIGFALSACGDDGAPADAGMADAARPDSSIFGAALPVPPDIPWLETGLPVAPPAPPVFAPCPEGFRETELGCEPWPASGMAACTGSSVHFPGEPGCSVVGGTCPTGAFAAGLPDDGSVIFVRRGATSGDGTRSSPHGTIAAAMAVASAGQRIALAKATYDEPVRFEEGVTVEGACADETILTATSALATVRSDAAGTALRNVTVQGGEGPGVLLTGMTATLDVEGVVVDDAKGIGILADSGARLVARDVVVRNTRSRDDGYFGRGLLVQTAATAEVERAVFSNNREVGVGTGLIGARTVLRRVAILDTVASIDDLSGLGAWVFDTGELELEAVVIERSHTAGIQVLPGAAVVADVVIVRDTRGAPTSGYRGQGLMLNTESSARVRRGSFVRNRREHVGVYGGSEVVLEDVVLDDALGLEGGAGEGRSVLATEGSRVEVRRARVTRSRSSGLAAYDTGTAIIAEDLVVTDTRAEESEGFGGRGVEALEGASIELTRAVIERNIDTGIFAASGSIHLTDVIVRDTVEADYEGGYGIGIGVGGSTVTGERVLVERNDYAGVLASGAGSVVTLTDIAVRETRDTGENLDASGFSIDARDDARIELTRALVEDGLVAGAGASAATLVLSDAVVRRIRSRVSNGYFGRGVIGQSSSRLELTRVEIADTREVGVFVTGSGTEVALTDVAIRDMQSSTATGRGGRGLELTQGATATLVRALVERAKEVGVFLSSGSVLDASDLVVRDTAEADCGMTTCQPFGHGLGAFNDATGTIQGFVIDGAALCGVEISDGGGLDLARGTITRTRIGACIHDSGYDITRLTMDVAYRDNGANIESVDFAVPEPTPSLGDVAP